jgi:hypothetical protein
MMKRHILAQQAGQRSNVVEKEDAIDAYIMVCVNSDTPASAVSFPGETSRNRLKLYPNILPNARNALVLVPMLGDSICRQYAAKDSTFVCWDLSLNQANIGVWEYMTLRREKRNAKMRSVRSWFRCLRSSVPQYVDFKTRLRATWEAEGWVPERTFEQDMAEFFIGQFQEFYRLEIPGWRAQPFFVGKARLFFPSKENPVTKLTTIDPRTANPFCPLHDRRVNIEYVDLSKIDCQLAMGPMHKTWQRVGDGKWNDQRQPLETLTVMPLMK